MKRIEAAGELRIRKGAGPKGANLYQVLMNPTLPLFAEQQEVIGGGKLPPGKSPGVSSRAQRGGKATPPDPSRTVSKDKSVSGGAAPTPVAACFQAYRDGITKRYGADYPQSRRANGMLSNVVDRLGAAPALKVVGFYLAHGKPYYSQRKHALEILVQDCTELWLELQATAGAGAPATTASAFFELGDGRMKLMNEYPVAEPRDVARACAREYASRIEPWSVRNIVVRIGGRQSKFTPQEVR
jgi:hypothetical protein